jgi:hypothetical protein
MLHGMTENKLPADTHLAYTVSHEAWYARTPGIVDQPQIMVGASAQGSGGGVAWEFSVTEHDFGGHGRAIKVGVFDDAFDDAFAAFAQIPEFFAALAAGDIDTLDKVALLLQHIGAVDETEREDPATHRAPSPTSPLRQAIRAAAVASYADSGGRRVLVIPESAIPAIAENATEG